MVRMLYSLAVLALLAAGGVFTLCILEWKGDAASDEASVLGGPSLIEQFKQRQGDKEPAPQNKATPLVAQANALASHLSPPRPAKATPTVLTPRPSAALRVDSKTMPPIRPATPSVHFKLHGTSYCPNQPERSMALIAERTGAEDAARWVKEGSQLGHFVIHEIRASAIVYRDGEQLREMAVEGRSARKSLVRRTRPDTGGIGPVAAEKGVMPSPPAGPNSVKIAGQN